MTRTPGLLPWQALFLACAAGAWAVHDFAAGLCAAVLVACVWRVCGAPRVSPLLFAAALLFGLGYAWLRLPEAPPGVEGWQAPRTRERVLGVVESVEERPGNRLEIILSEASAQRGDMQEPLPGQLAWTWQDPAFRPTPGSVVEVAARPRLAGGFDNPGVDGWGWRWRLRGVFLRLYTQGAKGVAVAEQAEPGAPERARMALREAILRGAGAGSAGGMVLGLVTGERFAIDRDDLERVRRASLAHLLAVSGMNLAAVAALGWGVAWMAGLLFPRLLLRLPRARLAVLVGLPLVAAYLWLGRFEPSLTRAAVMFAAWGLLVLLGRKRVLLDGLFLALAVMFLWNPLCVFDVGLQLSAAAVAGLILLLPLAAPLLARLRSLRPGGLLLAVPLGWLMVTLCSQVAVFPIQASVFGEASPHLYLNLLWVPVVEWAAQPLAYLGALTVCWLPAVGEPLLSGAALVCSWMIDSLRAMDAHGWLSTYPIQRPWWPEVLGFYALVGLAAAFAALDGRRRAAWLLAAVLLLALPPAWRAWDANRERVRLTMLDVGQGQSVLIEAPGGARYLVDGGGASGGFDLGRAVLAPVLTWGHAPALAGMALSHPDRDHSGGLVYPLSAFTVGFLATNGDLPRQRDFRDALAKSGLTPRVWRAGDAVELAPDVRLEVLHPPGDAEPHGNQSSLVLRLVWRGRGLAVLPGDAGHEGLAAALAYGQGHSAALDADVLVVPHHGSGRSFSLPFFRSVSPRLGLVSAGEGNSFGFPAADVVDALERGGAKVYSTARSGAVRVSWDAPDAPPEVWLKRGGVQ